MKKLSMLAMMMLVVLNSILAQENTTVTFRGELQNRAYLKLDSVLVTDITQDWHEVLYYPDTVISFSRVGIADNDNVNGKIRLYQNSPNPFHGVTDFNLVLCEKEKVDLAIYDINGRKVAEYQNTLPSGEHQFRASLNNAQTYLLSAVSKSCRTSVKMLNLGNVGESCRIELISSQPFASELIRKESQYGFNVGDEMRYVGYATLQDGAKEVTVTKALNESETITFTFPSEDSGQVITLSTDSAVVDSSVTLYGSYEIENVKIASLGFEYRATDDSIYKVVKTDNIESPFFVTLDNLLPGTDYTYVAYLKTTDDSLVRGEEKSFTTEIAIEAKEFNIENTVVQEYMSLSTAKFSTVKGNYAKSFFDATRSYRPDQPACKEITFKDSRATSAKVYLWSDDNAADKELIGEFALKDGVGTCSFCNLIPDRIYKYMVVSETGRKITTGGFKTCGQMRMIALEKGFNIRDLGGWTGLGGKKVKYEQIYRGGSLGGTDMYAQKSDIPVADKNELLRIGILAQLDLRASSNAGRYTNEGSYHSYSAGETTLLQSDFNNTMSDNGVYNEDPSLISDIAWIIYELKNGRPVYFNCRQGADRTGAIAFLIEGLLGCYEYTNTAGGNQMALDYELTGFSQANLIDNWKVTSSSRLAQEAYSSTSKIFRQLIDMKSDNAEISLANLQQKCYYYLNRYGSFKSGPTGLHIDKDDLDWFIAFMLGMSKDEYAPYKPAWAQSGGNLKQVGEACANVVNYHSK